MDKSQVEAVNSTFKKWNSAQAYLKEAELITQSASIPAINELRYAGRIFVSAALMARDLPNTFDIDEALTENTKNFSDSITVTNQYIDNATHDISDALIYHYDAAVKSLVSSYGIEGLSSRFPNVKKSYDIIEECKLLIIDSRANLVNREKNYVEVRSKIGELKDLYQSIVHADIIRTSEFKNKNKNMNYLYAGILLVSGILLGIFSSKYFFS